MQSINVNNIKHKTYLEIKRVCVGLESNVFPSDNIELNRILDSLEGGNELKDHDADIIKGLYTSRYNQLLPGVEKGCDNNWIMVFSGFILIGGIVGRIVFSKYEGTPLLLYMGAVNVAAAIVAIIVLGGQINTRISKWVETGHVFNDDVKMLQKKSKRYQKSITLIAIFLSASVCILEVILGLNNKLNIGNDIVSIIAFVSAFCGENIVTSCAVKLEQKLLEDE